MGFLSSKTVENTGDQKTGPRGKTYIVAFLNDDEIEFNDIELATGIEKFERGEPGNIFFKDTTGERYILNAANIKYIQYGS